MNVGSPPSDRRKMLEVLTLRAKSFNEANRRTRIVRRNV
jgi:hypothetical protein